MSSASIWPRPRKMYRTRRGIATGRTRSGARTPSPSSKRASGATWMATRPAYVYGSVFATSAKAARPSPAISSSGSKRPSRPPSPEKTTSASAPAAPVASSDACAGRSVNSVVTEPARASSASTARTRSSVTWLAYGFTISATSIISREHATTRPRRLRDARSGPHRRLLRACLRRADREDRRPPGDGVRRQHRLRVPRARRARRPRRGAGDRRGARGAQAPPRRGRDRVGGARPRDREGRLLPRSGRAAAGGDHLRTRRRPAPPVRKSAVVIEVPGAAPLVDEWRRHHTEDAPLGVPAHVTLLTPFVPAERIDEEVEERLAAPVGAEDPVDFVLPPTPRLDQPLLYLPPGPGQPFLRPTQALLAG